MDRRGIKILLIGGGIWYFGEGLFGPLLAVFSTRIGGTLLDLSWAWATYLIVYGLLSIAFGRISDTKINKARLMVFGYALNALFTFGYLFVHNSISLFLVQAGLGVAAAIATPTWNALFGEFSDVSEDGTEWGISEGVRSIVTAISIVIGSLIVTHYSFTALFIVMGVVQIAATIYQASILYLTKEVGLVN